MALANVSHSTNTPDQTPTRSQREHCTTAAGGAVWLQRTLKNSWRSCSVVWSRSSLKSSDSRPHCGLVRSIASSTSTPVLVMPGLCARSNTRSVELVRNARAMQVALSSVKSLLDSCRTQ